MPDRPPRARRPLAVVAGSLAGALAGALFVVVTDDAVPQAAPPAQEVEVRSVADGVAQVAVLSRLLDVFSTGAAAGPGIVNGVVATVVGSQQLPPPADEVQTAIVQGFTDLGAIIKDQGQAGVEQLRGAIAPLACANPVLDQGIEVIAGALDAVAGLGATVAPLDLTAAELAVLIRSFAAPVVPCG